jgi:hypothetical protein
LAGSQPIADGSGSDGLPIGSQPLAQVKRKRTRGGRIERCRREAKLIIRIAARKADGAGSTTANERFSRTAATYAEAARRAIDVNAEAHRADIAHRTAAQAATGLPGVTQVDADIPAAVRMAQPQAGSIVQLATQAADIIAAVTEAAAIIAAAIQTDACALAISTSSKITCNAGSCTCATAISAAAGANVTGQAENAGQAAAAAANFAGSVVAVNAAMIAGGLAAENAALDGFG